MYKLNLILISLLAGHCVARNIKDLSNSALRKFLKLRNILRSQNKNDDLWHDCVTFRARH